MPEIRTEDHDLLEVEKFGGAVLFSVWNADSDGVADRSVFLTREEAMSLAVDLLTVATNG